MLFVFASMFQRLLRMVTSNGHLERSLFVVWERSYFSRKFRCSACSTRCLDSKPWNVARNASWNAGRRAIKDALRRSSLFTTFVLQTLYHQRRLKVESRFYFLLTCSRRSACSRAAALLSIGQQNLLFLTDQMTVNLILGERFFSIIPRQRRKYVLDIASDPRT